MDLSTLKHLDVESRAVAGTGESDPGVVAELGGWTHGVDLWPLSHSLFSAVLLVLMLLATHFQKKRQSNFLK